VRAKGTIKAVVFDLDDTLFDCSGCLVDASRRRAAAALVEHGLPMSAEEAYRLQKDLSEAQGPFALVFDEIGRRYGLPRQAIDAAYRAYNSDEVESIRPFPDARPTLRALREAGIRTLLLTSGVYQRQAGKVELLGLAEDFDEIFINDVERGLLGSEALRHLLRKHNLRPHETVFVGHRPHVEIRAGNELGAVTVQMLHGRFRDAEPRDEHEVPFCKVNHLFQVPTVVSLLNASKPPEALKIVAIGGGTGLPIVLNGFKPYSRNLTAVVTVMDSGRSSGRLRSELGMLPPGDARNCLVALCETGRRERELYELFKYRFSQGSFDGMSLGNLIIAALTDITGSFEKAIKRLSDLMNIHGKVLPSTVTDTHICAELEDGTVLEEEVNVRGLNKAPIRRVFLKNGEAEVLPEVVDEILSADIVILGPGSLFTSVIVNLLVPAIREAIARSSARAFYVCNVMTQPGQTDGFNAADHVRAVLSYLEPGSLDGVIVNSNTPREEILRRYEQEGAYIAEITPELRELGPRVIEADLVEDIDQTRVLWEKQDLLRHNPDKLADTICRAWVAMSQPQAV
jgi:uncharacterized cofD-like protein